MRTYRAALLFFGVTMFVTGPVAGQSATPTPDLHQCVANARQNAQDCKAQCDDDFIAAKFVCQGISPSCGIPCLAGFTACRQLVENILDTGQLPNPTPGAPPIPLDNCSGGTNACDQTFKDAKQVCYAASCPSGQTCTSCQITDNVCNDCVDAAQVAHFTCRDACRDSWRIATKFMKKLCRKSFAACKNACKNTP